MIKLLKKKVGLLLDRIVNKLLIRNSVINKIKQLGHLYEKEVINSSISEKTRISVPYRISDTIIGDYTYLAEGAKLSQVNIGKFCSIGPNLLAGYGIHPLHGISTAPMFYSTLKQNGISLSSINKVEERKPIQIGNDVFIGANVTILDGITIGSGSVIGAGAVVSKDIPPYAIAVGCPIKVIKYRFSKDEIESLLKIKWWDWDEKKLLEVEKYFHKVEEFISNYKHQ